MVAVALRPFPLSIGLLLLASLVAQASWTPQPDEWSDFRGGLTHTGEASGTSVFTAGVGGPARVKWSVEVPHPVLYPPSVGDLTRDGVKEVIVTPNDVKTQVGPPPDINFLHRVMALNGATGATTWNVEEVNSFALFSGANVVDFDADANAEVLHFAGNPLTGTSATNQLVGRSHTGAVQWRFSDAIAWGGTQHPVGILAAPQAANVDAEAQKEAIFGVILADITVGTTQQGPGCPNPEGQKLKIEGSNIRSFVHAVNGETGSPSNSWSFSMSPGLLGSTPAVVDLNGDGKLDSVWGSGAPAGVLIPSCSAEVSVDGSAVDDRVIAIDGANPPATLWTATFENPPGVRRPIPATPTVAGTTPGGDPILAFLVPVAPTEPAANDPDRNILMALNGRTGATLWTVDIRPASIAPLAAADLDGDGQPEIIVQVANRLATFRNDGTNFWAQGTTALRGVSYARPLTAFGVAVADIDSDGVKEILTILDGARTGPMAQLLVVSGANGAVEWTFDLLQDDALGGPAVADVDGDDTLLEIIVGGGSFTLGDAADHTGRVIVLEPNAADLSVTNLEVLGDLVKGNPQTVRATVANPGTRDAVNAAVRLLANGAPVGPDATATVPAGGSVLVDFPWTPSGSGPHTLLARADPADALRELVETNNERSLAVTVLKRFDLSIVPADVTFSPAQPILGDTVTVTATVRNVGEAATPASSILRFEEAGIPLSEDRTIPVLNPGASSEASVSFTVAEERTHHFVITADPANALVEEREDNNVAMKDLEILVVRPDLSIVPADVTFSPPQPILGDTVTVTATVRNVGDLATPGSSVVRFEEAGIPLSEDRTVPQLNPGGSAQASITFTVAEERTHHFVVTADPDDAIDETSEANNVAAKDLAVLVVRPDLSIVAADISFSHANPPVGETVTISATVRNLGNQNAPASKARIIENGTAIGPDLDVPAIPQGGSANVQQSFTIVEEREHAFTVVVDALNAITESNEANNQATKTLPVRTTAADLVAASLAASPGIADPGQAVGLSATFRNDGNRSLSGFTVSFFDGATLLGTAPGPALAEGASATVPFTWTSTEPRGVHTLRAVGAPVGLEQRSDNNEAAVGVVVGTLAVAVVMDKATYGVDEPVTGQAAVTFTGTNLGVPGVPVVVDVYYRVVAGLTAEVHRARLTGETDADGQFAFVVPKTLLGGVNVCVNNMCPINQGDPLGLGKNVPGDYRVRAEADRLGFKFDANGFYSVAA